MTNPVALLDQLREAGIRLVSTDSGLGADVLPGAAIEPHRQAIAQLKPSLLEALALQDRIVATATASPDQFNRDEYDRLWREWYALEREP